MTPVRTMVVWCPDWPAERNFEPVVAALDALTPRLEVVEPGCCAIPTRGPSRYFGGDLALARRAAALVAGALAEAESEPESGPDPPDADRQWFSEVRVGIADGPFAATLAARTARAAGAAGPTEGDRNDPQAVQAVQMVPPAETPAFLAPLSLTVLERPDFVDLLRRLGLRTLGDLAALPVAKVVGRFGEEGLAAHRLASGLDPELPAAQPPPAELTAVAELEVPAERVEALAFVARGLADDLHQRLTRQGSACTRLLVGAESEHGERHERVWRTEGVFGAVAIAERVRWQLEGWASATAGRTRTSGGITRLWLVPEEVVPAGGNQLAFGTGTGGGVDVAAADRAGRAVARVQGLIGPARVTVPEWSGGRGPSERVHLVAADSVDLAGVRPAAQPDRVGEPWPGTVPPPAPATVFPAPRPVEVVGEDGRPVAVSGRGELSAAPRQLGGREVVAWSAPWVFDERWWDRVRHRRRTRLQVLTAEGRAHLVMREGGRWWLEATYD